ncbi:MAG TPA: hypothetical protein VFR09_07760 [Alphaproteobacteria bacterium]|nr:hypothetical protein [Alphaproteobacteria bacterium]
MKSSISRLALLAALATLPALSASAQEVQLPKQDDRVVFDVSGEDWVMTKTAHVTVNVEAAVNGNNAGSMRNDMVKAVNDLSKGDWRLTAFNRSQDSTGLERWSSTFEARLPENQLNGLEDSAKKLSKVGMQMTVGDINFSPTLDEMEAARGGLRTKIFKEVSDQLTALNSTLPGRNYRIAMINFSGTGDEPMPVAMPRVVRGQAMMMAANSSAPMPAATPPMERAEKIEMTARVVFAASDKPAAK